MPMCIADLMPGGNASAHQKSTGSPQPEMVSVRFGEAPETLAPWGGEVNWEAITGCLQCGFRVHRSNDGRVLHIIPALTETQWWGRA